MSQQTMGRGRPMQIIRRHKVLVSAVTAAGLILGIGVAVLHPPLPSSEALIVIPQNAPNIATEVVIVGSEPVLSAAVNGIQPAESLQTLESRVQVKSITSSVISVTAKGSTGAQAESAADAVAKSYIDYVGEANNPVGHVSAQLLQSATTATTNGPVKQDFIDGLIGLLIGLVLGIAGAIALGRLDRKLRGRDDIANSIGVPVLAAVQAVHPSGAAGWTTLLDEYQPGPVEGWRLRQALAALGFTTANVNDRAPGGIFSLTVLSMTSDPGALALGPQLAVFAAAIGIPTVLVIGPQEDTNATAALWTACAAPPSPSKRPSYLRTVAADSVRVAVPQGARLVVVVAVVDPKAPALPDTMPTTTTLLAVSAGAGTAEQLARVATVAAADEREVTGFLVADPESADHGSGRVPRPARAMPRVPAPPARPTTANAGVATPTKSAGLVA
jgi:capsular polysaccharide biosynthesis protein